ncbi:MAG: beta-L-arabinofuranosidase domain-containing protein, partial [Burkholderiaceae bacterium]
IGDLCWTTLTDGGIDITQLGNHHGLSATVLIDPAVELYFATRERRYLDLALLIVDQAGRRAELNLLTRVLGGADASEIGTGKAYQLTWNLAALAKLHRATGDASYLNAARNGWRSIHDHHLTLGGGPWGGVAHRSREVFNPAGVFSPYGYVETCSILAWIQLNRELLAITGDSKYADEIERAAYNDLLGAQAPNGEDWIYYSFPNGQRVFTTYWRCCKSSGPMALEELPAVAYQATGNNEITVNLYGPGEASVPTLSAGTVELRQSTRYPFDGDIRIRLTRAKPARFTIRVRIPIWASESQVEVNGAKVQHAAASFAAIERDWRAGDEIALRFPMTPVLHRQSNRNVQESVAPDGSAVRQQVLRFDYAAITRGPLVYATDLIDGFKTEETVRLS